MIAPGFQVKNPHALKFLDLGGGLVVDERGGFNLI